MRQKALDRRVKRTRANLRASITKLLHQKPVNEITVREISEGADINRATFYLHYKDVYDMIDKIENEMFEEFEKIISAHSPEEFKEHPFLVIQDIFTFLDQNKDMCSALLSPNGDMAFVEKLKAVLWKKCAYDWEKLYGNNGQIDLGPYISFVLSGSIGLLSYWLDDQKNTRTAEEMAKMAEQMIMRGLHSLEN